MQVVKVRRVKREIKVIRVKKEKVIRVKRVRIIPPKDKKVRR